MKYILFIFCFFLFMNLPFAQNFPASRYNTLGHKLIAWEQLAADSNNTAFIKTANYYRLLDSIIDVSKKQLPEYDHKFNQSEVLQTFSTIDSILYSFGFYVCVYVDYLSDALDTINTVKQNRQKQHCNIFSDKIAYRKKFMKELTIAHKMDCDVSSIIYYSISQVMGYPVFMVEVPDHSFVRWRNNDSSYFNWDTNAAMSISNDCYKYECGRWITTGFNDDKKGYDYLIDMDSTRIKAYWLPGIGVIYRHRKMNTDAEKLYNQAIQIQENNIYAMYCLSYMYLYDTIYNNSLHNSKAYHLANKAWSLVPNNKHEKPLTNSIMETCGCAEAVTGDFAGAIQLVKKSTRDKKLIKGFKAGKKCCEIYPNRD